VSWCGDKAGNTADAPCIDLLLSLQLLCRHYLAASIQLVLFLSVYVVGVGGIADAALTNDWAEFCAGVPGSTCRCVDVLIEHCATLQPLARCAADYLMPANYTATGLVLSVSLGFAVQLSVALQFTCCFPAWSGRKCEVD
jgi:hypothetical protein